MTDEQIQIAAKHFIIAAIWADAPENTNPRATKQAQDDAEAFVKRFVEAYPVSVNWVMQCEGYGSHPDAGSPAAAFGHDLYLTCRGHGVGFADRPELAHIGKMLADDIRADGGRWHCEPIFYRGWLYF